MLNIRRQPKDDEIHWRLRSSHCSSSGTLHEKMPGLSRVRHALEAKKREQRRRLANWVHVWDDVDGKQLWEVQDWFYTRFHTRHTCVSIDRACLRARVCVREGRKRVIISSEMVLDLFLLWFSLEVHSFIFLSWSSLIQTWINDET